MSHRACQRFIESFFFLTVRAVPANLLDAQGSPKPQHFPLRARSRICRGFSSLWGDRHGRSNLAVRYGCAI